VLRTREGYDLNLTQANFPGLQAGMDRPPTSLKVTQKFEDLGEDLAGALKLKGAALFDPMGGRPMREWVVVPVVHAKRWPEFANAALAYVAG
jgi:hypothetical protein